MKKNKSKIILALILPVIIILHLSLCVILYFFEPVSYYAPDLSLSDFTFALYGKFDYNNNNEFYIKQLDYTDIMAASGDERLKYVDNTIIIISEPDASYSDIDTLLDDFNGNICGYIDVVNFYQADFTDIGFEDLQNICSELSNNDLVKIAMVDYFEESPVAETHSESYSFEYNDYYYHDIINTSDVWKITDIFEKDAVIGMIDIPVFSSHKDLYVINSADYQNDLLDNEKIITSPSHGTHVAGIMSADSDSEIPGIFPGAKIYSENGMNNSVSYWIAAIVNMIVNNINVINISMGYNSYIPISASLGCEFSQKYITDENELFEAVLRNVLDSGYEFLFCIAAGNETNYSLYKTNSDYFSYGEKELLRKWDIFDIFSSKPEYCDTKYQFSLTAIDDESIRNRIMLVGSCNEFKRYSYFASAGEAVDIVAPGENIYSTGYTHEYEHMSGTSMASPLVAGTAALLFASDNSLTGAQVKDIIINSSTEKVSAYGFDYPLLNTGNAVDYVNNK